MKVRAIFMIGMVFVVFCGLVQVDAAALDVNVIDFPYTKATIDGDETDVINLSTALVGAAEIPLISFEQTGIPQIQWAHLATQDVPGNCPSNAGWKCDFWGVTTMVNGSLSNVGTDRFGPDTFGLAWAFSDGTYIQGWLMEYFNNMSRNDINWEYLIEESKFGGTMIGAPSIELVGGHFRLAAVFRDNGDIRTYQLVYLHYVGGSNTSCYHVASGYQCDVIEVSVATPLGQPSLAYAGGDTGIAYTKGNAVRYAYPWGSIPGRASNCGPGGDTWRCIDIDAPSVGTIGTKLALAYGSDRTHAALLYNHKPTTKDMIMRATYVGSGGNCGKDGYLGTDPVYRWDCSDLDAFIDNINNTTFALTFDPNNYPVASWNNKFTGDEAQRLYVGYPNARVGAGGGWQKHIVDGNDWSTTGIWNNISIKSAGLTFIGYMQPTYRACGDPGCAIDLSDNLRMAAQWFRTYAPIVLR